MKIIKTVCLLFMFTLIIVPISSIKGEGDRGDVLDFNVERVQEYPGFKIFTITAENQSHSIFRFGSERDTNHFVVRTDEGRFESEFQSSVSKELLEPGTTTYRIVAHAPGEIQSLHMTHLKIDAVAITDTYTVPVDASEYQVYNITYILVGVLALFVFILLVRKDTMNTLRFLLVAAFRVFALFLLANLILRRSELPFILNGIGTTMLVSLIIGSIVLSAVINRVFGRLEAASDKDRHKEAKKGKKTLHSVEKDKPVSSLNKRTPREQKVRNETSHSQEVQTPRTQKKPDRPAKLNQENTSNDFGRIQKKGRAHMGKLVIIESVKTVKETQNGWSSYKHHFKFYDVHTRTTFERKSKTFYADIFRFDGKSTVYEINEGRTVTQLIRRFDDVDDLIAGRKSSNQEDLFDSTTASAAKAFQYIMSAIGIGIVLYLFTK